MTIELRPPGDTRWDCVSLGEVMLRLDPGFGRVRTARSFAVHEGGGEYNVARAISKVFGMRSAIVTALVDNEVGHLVEDLMMAGGVGLDHVSWVPFDGLGFTRVGLNFTEKGFGIRPPLGVSDRANSAASKMSPGDVDWDRLFRDERSRWFHTGGIFSGLSETCSELALEGMRAARSAGTIVSYDVNVRASLWREQGRDPAEVNRRMLEHVDVVFGSIADYRIGLGFEIEDRPVEEWVREPERFTALAEAVCSEFPDVQAVAMSLRDSRTAGFNHWGGLLVVDGEIHVGRFHRNLEVYDRVGGGDGFVSGVVWALLDGRPPAEAVEVGVAHGALTMTTPGDTSMATRDEVLRAITASDARADREGAGSLGPGRATAWSVILEPSRWTHRDAAGCLNRWAFGERDRIESKRRTARRVASRRWSPPSCTPPSSL
jgi:2-dehydro-3-deoxygluconokinase